jgi:hypothetical protein
MLLFLMFDMAGGWSAPLVGTAMQDIYGNTITVGSFVRFVGKVTALFPSDPHFGQVQVMPVHPNTFIPDVQLGQVGPQSLNFAMSDPNTPTGAFGFDPKQLIVGA